MPEIYRLHGIKLYVYYGEQHGIPHLHANDGDDWASYRIDDASLLEGGLPRSSSVLVKKWIKTNRVAIMRAWERACAGQEPGRIGGGGRRHKTKRNTKTRKKSRTRTRLKLTARRRRRRQT